MDDFTPFNLNDSNFPVHGGLTQEELQRFLGAYDDLGDQQQLVIEQPGRWPEFVRPGDIIKVEMEDDTVGWWQVREATFRGIFLDRVV